MTPKEKAKELVDKMYGDELDYMTEGQAKQCALIAVDEMIDELYHIPASNETREYWQEVKQEIEAL
jgi:hypothetical protein